LAKTVLGRFEEKKEMRNEKKEKQG